MGDDVRLLRRIELPARSECSRDLVSQLACTRGDTGGPIQFYRQSLMTLRWKMFCEVAKVRNQSNRAEFDEIPETQNSVNQDDVHGMILYRFADESPDLTRW